MLSTAKSANVEFQQVVQLYCNLVITLMMGAKRKACYNETRMWANAQRDGRPAEHRWRPLFNAAKFAWLTPNTGVSCSNAAKTRNPLKLAGVPQTNERISATRQPKFTIL